MIKFRARNMKENRWIPPDKFLINPEGKVMTRADATAPWVMATDPIWLFQFTCVPDANGNEIYDGHILAPVSINQHERFIVRKRADGAGFFLKSINGGSDRPLEINTYGYALYKIIGHILDNPELLAA